MVVHGKQKSAILSITRAQGPCKRTECTRMATLCTRRTEEVQKELLKRALPEKLGSGVQNLEIEHLDTRSSMSKKGAAWCTKRGRKTNNGQKDVHTPSRRAYIGRKSLKWCIGAQECTVHKGAKRTKKGPL